ncbi:MAG: DUF1905 domain-containing protein [Bacteroidota bacterium]|nr:DUF1905 domain-containing protein [Bacteroidota bacterium]
MLRFNTTIEKFGEQGEKTGWTYIRITAKQAQQLKPDNKKSFRVKGKLDAHAISGVALIPMGGGDFIMALNTSMRKAIGKKKGDKLTVQLATDEKLPVINKTLLTCLADEPIAAAAFNKMPRSHQLYYSRWIESAKTESTQAKRIAMTVSALLKKMNFGEMLRAAKKDREELRGGR